MPPTPPPSKTQQYDCKWYIPLTDLSFQTVDESEAAPSIPLVLDEELDAMKIKISQIKSDIQREKVRGQGRGGGPGWLCSSGGSSTSQWVSSAGPLTHCGSLGPAGTPKSTRSTRHPIRHGAVQARAEGAAGLPCCPCYNCPNGERVPGGGHGPSGGSDLHPADPWWFLERSSLLREQ